jgi:hypothetical protein
MGLFSSAQMSEEIVDRIINDSPTLSRLRAECVELLKLPYDFDEITGEEEVYGRDGPDLLGMIQESLIDTGGPYDLRYPEKAIHQDLLESVDYYRKTRKESEVKKQKWTNERGWR